MPEANRGVITGATSSSRPPPLPPVPRNLPKLAPPRRDADPGSSSIDIVLDDLVTEAAPGTGARPSLLPPICLFGRYEILGRLAFGGMAEIFLGREPTAAGAARNVVIKRILPHVADEEKFVRMFLDEARLAIQLNHPNICHIYEFGELEGSYFIAMEWVDGVPLGKLIRRARTEGGVPIEIGVRIAAQVAEALHYAHRARDALGRPMNIVHRDVTPHNVMVAYDGQVKLLDFGIAKATTHSTKTEAGMVKGKFSYMSPEQCLGRAVDCRSDVFALGICLWEALVGRSLFHRETEYETMNAVINEPPAALREHRKDVPVSLDAIVHKALAKDAANRFQTAGELQTALERWFADERKVVNAQAVAAFMEQLYKEEIARGPLVDSNPFGQSFQRMPSGSSPSMRDGSMQRRTSSGSMPSVGSGSVPAVSGPRPIARANQFEDPEDAPTTIAGEEKKPSRKGWLAAIAAVLVLLAVGGGIGLAFLVFGQPAQPVASSVPAREVAPPVETAPAAEVADEVPPPVEAPPRAPVTGTLRIEWQPASASVTVNGERIEGSSPLTRDLTPGTHTIVATAAGHQRFEETVEIAPGAEAVVRAVLAPLGPAAAPATLSINTRPWSKVYVGARLLGTTPIADARVSSGVVRLRLVDRDNRTHARSVRVAPGGAARVFYDLDE
jgi:serine/threonine-protein kinase